MYPNDDNFRYVKDETTIILDTTEKLVIEDKFTFETPTCLVYAETIEIVGSVTLPGQSLGLFCHHLSVPKQVRINLSGRPGATGTSTVNKDGEPGGPGADGGNLWLYVQEFSQDDLGNLELWAFGGDGGRGGDASGVLDGGTAVKGGVGGNGAAGGLIEVSLGTSPAAVMAELRAVDKQPWPAKVSSLLAPQVSQSLASLLSEDDKTVLDVYQQLNNAMQKLHQTLVDIANQSPGGSTAALVDPVLAKLKELCASAKYTPDVDQTMVSDLDAVVKRLREGAQVAEGLKAAADSLQRLSPSPESDFESLLSALWDAVKLNKTKIEAAIGPKLKDNRGGVAGSGGGSGPGVAPGAKGAKGADGKTRILFLELSGSKQDLDVTQAYVFPEQCQMLLNKADSRFFGLKQDEQAEVLAQYERLVRRLHFVTALGDTGASSGLGTALGKLESTLKITRNSIGQLEAIYGQAKSRKSRLLLGQDMLGHDASWVPRLSYDYYTETLKDRLAVLKELEEIESQYRDAMEKDAETANLIAKGMQKMEDARKEAQSKMDLLTGPNGTLSQTADKISALTVEMREERDVIKDDIRRLHLTAKVDMLDAMGTLTTVDFDVASLKKLLNLWKAESTDLKGSDGKLYRTDFVIGQLADCADSLESLEGAVKTASDNTLMLDDPGALKVIAKRGDIDKIIDKFADSIPADFKKQIRAALDKYMATTLLRNQAVVNYNSSIYLLLEARHEESYARSQASSLADQLVKLDPGIPALAFWLRRTRDGLRLELTQRLDLARRAVMYWGLSKSTDYSQSGPLRNAAKLDLDRVSLDKAFEDILTRYAGNIRSTWPPTEDQPGLFYQLTDDQLVSLTKGVTEAGPGSPGQVYKVSISLSPGDEPFGKGRADVRLNEVRLWLIGAAVKPDNLGRQRVLAHLEHMGQDEFQDEKENRLSFSHDMVSIPFEYDTAKVKSSQDLTPKAKLNRANAMQDDWTGGKSRAASSMAAIGPFATWRLSVRERENSGLDMSGVTSAYMEFQGANRSFK